MSVFFTLSGFLITSLLAAETERDGRRWRWVRSTPDGRDACCRPACCWSVLVDPRRGRSPTGSTPSPDLRAHVVGSLLQVANWVFLASDGSYQELLHQAAGAASPLEHYWSLAIEEQFYWIWPVAFVGLWQSRPHATAGREAVLRRR